MTTQTETDTRDASTEHLLAETNRLLPAVLQALEAGHERGQQLYPGHSSMGRCRRAAGYGYRGTEPDVAHAPRVSVQSWIGTAVHRTFLPVMRDLLHPARIEMATMWHPPRALDLLADHDVLGTTLPPITGHVDLYRRRSQLVLDVKTVPRHTLDRVMREGPREKDLLQIHANAASLTAEGKPVATVGLMYVCTETSAHRADADGWLYLQPVDQRVIDADVAWWREVTSTEPDQLPRDERGPGLSWACDECPFLRRCWGANAEPGVVGGQQLLAAEDDAVVSALAMLLDAQERYTAAGRLQRAADADKDFAAAILADTAGGAYVHKDGQAIELSWKPGQLRADQGGMAEALQALGQDVPKKRGAAKPVAKVVQL